MKLRAAIGIGALVLTFSAPVSAQAATQAESGAVEAGSCPDAAAQVVAGSATASSSYDYVCTVDQVIVEMDSGAVVTQELSTPSPIASLASSSSANFCTWNQPPVRTITSPTTEDIQFGLFYGQTDHPVNGSWTEAICSRITTSLQFYQHEYTVRSLGGGSATVNWSATVTYYDHPSPTFLDSLDIASFNITGEDVPGIAALGTVGEGWGDTPATIISRIIRYDNIHINQPARGFSIDVPGNISTYRFMCQNTSVTQACFWPNGQEAQFGMAGR